MHQYHRVIVGVFFIAACGIACATGSNLVPNGEFATTINGWTVPLSPEPPCTESWNTDDADGNASSGSMEIAINAACSATALRSSCFTVLPSANYRYGGQSKVAAGSAISIGFVCRAFSSSDCSDTAVSLVPAPVMSSSSVWTPAAFANGTLPATAQSANCTTTIASGPAVSGSVQFDNLSFSSDSIFSSGFE